METSRNGLTLTRSEIVKAVMGIRHEWEEAARGSSLVEVETSVGYLLADIALALGFNREELQLALGDLADELADVLS